MMTMTLLFLKEEEEYILADFSHFQLVAVDLEAEEVLVAQDFNNGNWYGIPNGDLNRGLGGQIVELKDDSQIVWINEQKAKPVEKS